MILHIIQARSNSERLPGKIFKKIDGKTLLEWHIKNTARSRGEYPDWLTVITMPYGDSGVKRAREIADRYGVKVYNFPAPKRDVLKEYVLVANEYSPEWIVRTTADCPFIDNDWFKKTIEISTISGMPIFNTYKEGSCTEVFRYTDLLRADNELKPMDATIDIAKYLDDRIKFPHSKEDFKYHREHCTSYFRKGFKKESIDTKEEYLKAKELYERR